MKYTTIKKLGYSNDKIMFLVERKGHNRIVLVEKVPMTQNQFLDYGEKLLLERFGYTSVPENAIMASIPYIEADKSKKYYYLITAFLYPPLDKNIIESYGISLIEPIEEINKLNISDTPPVEQLFNLVNFRTAENQEEEK